MQNPGVSKKITCSKCKEQVEYSRIIEVGINGCTCNTCYVSTHRLLSKEEIIKAMR
jgi:hypothetical protein